MNLQNGRKRIFCRTARRRSSFCEGTALDHADRRQNSKKRGEGRTKLRRTTVRAQPPIARTVTFSKLGYEGLWPPGVCQFKEN